MSVWRELADAAQTLWQWLRVWCGDAAYERYQRAMERKQEPLMLNARQFYLQQLEHKYSRPNRCC